MTRASGQQLPTVEGLKLLMSHELNLVPQLINPLFIARMQAELEANAHKGDWPAWHPTPALARSELEHHVRKLLAALERGDREKVTEHAADVANYVMKIAEVYGTLAAAPDQAVDALSGAAKAQRRKRKRA